MSTKRQVPTDSSFSSFQIAIIFAILGIMLFIAINNNMLIREEYYNLKYIQDKVDVNTKKIENMSK